MSLLKEIQDGATDSKMDLASLLRRCQLLGARVGSAPVEEWVKWELSGYPENAELPPYRMLLMEIRGHFSGPLGSGITNAAIPPASLPSEHLEKLTTYRCRDSVSAIEDAVAQGTGPMRADMGDLSILLGNRVYQRMHCYQAWGLIGRSGFVNILSSVRNRVLDLSIELWKREPNLGEIPPSAANTAMMTQVFNTTVTGGAMTLVVPGRDASVSVKVSQGDFGQLKRVLQDNQVAPDDIAELNAALKAEPQATGGSFGPGVAAWIGKMTTKAADGSWQISLGAAGNLLATAIGKYYGF